MWGRSILRPWRSTLLTNGIIFGAGLAGGVLAARFLGAEDRGLLAAIIFWPHFLTGIASMGLNEGIVIRTARSGPSNTLRATIFSMSIALALPVGIVGFFLLPLLLGTPRQEYLRFSQIYLLALAPAAFLANNFLAIDHGESKFDRFNVQRIVQAVAYPLLLLGLWLAGILNVEYAAIAVLAGTIIVALLRIWSARSGLGLRPSTQEAGQLIALSLRVHVANIATALSLQIDKMVLVLFSNNTELGLYSVAIVAAAAFVSLLVQTYVNVMLPIAAQLGPEQHSSREIIVPLRWLFAVIGLSTASLVLLMPHLVIFVFGREFERAGSYAQVLLLGFAFVGAKQALVYLLRAWGANRPAILGEGVTTLILIIGAYFAVRLGGTMGLCVLVVFAQAAGAVLVSFHFLRKIGLTLGQFLGLRPIAAR